MCLTKKGILNFRGVKHCFSIPDLIFKKETAMKFTSIFLSLREKRYAFFFFFFNETGFYLYLSDDLVVKTSNV